MVDILYLFDFIRLSHSNVHNPPKTNCPYVRMNAEIPETIKATHFGLGMQILEILARLYKQGDDSI